MTGRFPSLTLGLAVAASLLTLAAPRGARVTLAGSPSAAAPDVPADVPADVPSDIPSGALAEAGQDAPAEGRPDDPASVDGVEALVDSLADDVESGRAALAAGYAPAREALAAARDARTLRGALEALARASGGRARVVEAGTAGDGRPLLGLELGPAGAPGVVVLPWTAPLGDHDPAPAPGDQALGLTDLAHALLAADPTLTRLDRRRVVVLAGARPDRLAPVQGAGAVDPALNFPVDRDLAVLRDARSGDYPLQAPESRALARWLDRESRFYAALLVGSAPLDPRVLQLGDPASDGALRALSARPALVAAARGAAVRDEPTPGGLARHARLRAGLAVVGAPAPRDESATRSADLALLAAATLELLDAAPTLVLTAAPSPRLVGGELWRVDVTLANGGRLATASLTHSRERRPRWVEVGVLGADLRAAAVAGVDGVFRVVDLRVDAGGRTLLRLRDLGPGDALSLRLFVSGPAGARPRDEVLPLTIRAEAPRALPTSVVVPLAAVR